MIDLQNSNCKKCGLCSLRTNVVNGKGPLNAKIMLVGEWPGSPEDKTGDIWSGPIGREVKRILTKAGINWTEVYLTTTVRCVPKAPPSNDPHAPRVRDPKKEEIEACSDYLDKEIAAIQPNVIVPMGTFAVRRIFGKVATIKSTRGAEFWSEKYNCKIIPVYHPILLQRMPEHEGFTIEDFRRIRISAETKELTPKQLGHYITVDTIEKFDETIKRLNSVSAFAYDIETNSLNFLIGKVLCMAFTWKAHTGVCIPITRYIGTEKTEIVITERKVRKKVNGQWVENGVKQIPKEKKSIVDTYEPFWGDKQEYVLEQLRRVFNNDASKVAHNGKFDNKFLVKQLNICPFKFIFDTMLAHHLLNENAEGMHDLKECAWNYTDMGGYEDPIDNWFDERSITRKKRNYAHLPPEMLYLYNPMDTDVTFQLYEQFKPRIEEEGLSSLMNRLIMPLSETLMEAELIGTLIDKDLLAQYKTDLNEELETRRKILSEEIGKMGLSQVATACDFDSNDQLADLFYNHLHLPILSRTEKSQKPSCDEATLKELAKQHKIPEMVLAYREISNLLSKYIIGLEKRLDSNCRLHTTFLIHGTVTGRLSSSDPNLQNIPKSPVHLSNGKSIYIKNLFIPDPGYLWIEADYGQAEFRHWANYSQDPDMIRDIIAADNGTGPDIHKKTASQAWGVTIEQVTKQMRDAAKRIVFGIMYGRGAESIAEQLSIELGRPFPVEDAQRIITQFLARYPVAKAWLDAAIEATRQYKQIRDIFGRIRRLPGINSPLDFVRQENERLAMNSPIQAAASDMNCNAANRIRLAFKDKNIDGRILILVHDAIYCRIAKDDFEKGVRIIKDEMERPIEAVTVPMRAEFKTGTRWGDVKTYEFENVAA